MTSPIRGRAGELEVIGALVTAVAEGRGGVLVIEGPPGIGKSRLLTEMMVLADKCGVGTLFGEAFEYQQTVPFFSLFMATLRADPPVGDAEALRRLGSSADLRYWVVHDLQDAINAAAERTPLAIVLEDIQWADSGTPLALRSLGTGRSDMPVLWVLTARTGAGGPAARKAMANAFEEVHINYEGRPIAVGARPRGAKVAAGDHLPHVSDQAVSKQLGAVLGADNLGHTVVTVASHDAAPTPAGQGQVQVLVTREHTPVPGYHTVIADPHAAIADRLGLNNGGRVVVRPDGYIGTITTLKDTHTIADYFTRIGAKAI